MSKKINLDTAEFINLVRQYFIVWYSRLDDDKIAENKPIAWEKIAQTMKCDRAELDIRYTYNKIKCTILVAEASSYRSLNPLC